MPRPKRPGWSKITITVSEEVSREIRILAASRGEEMGTLVDYAIKHLTGLAASRGGASEEIPSWIPARAIRPVVSETVSHRATAIGRGNPIRVAVFVLQKLNDDPIAGPFTPLKHLKVTGRLTLQSISASMFRSIIAKAIPAAQFEVGAETDAKTMKFLDAVIQSTDRFIRCLKTAFRLDAEWRTVWTPKSAASFGILFGERLAKSLDEDTVETASEEAAVAVAGMVVSLVRERSDATELLKDGHPSALAALLIQGSHPKRRRRDPESFSDEGDITSSLMS